MDTKTKILDAAERLFGEHGVEATSLRAITREAGVNLAAVNYHFQSKESLFQAIVERRLGPINEQRAQMLKKFEEAANGQPLTVEQILDALIRPIFDAAYLRQGRKSPFIFNLVGRVLSDPDLRKILVLKEALTDTLMAFRAHFRRALPECPERELLWGMYFSFGCAAHSLTSGSVVSVISNGVCDPSDSETLLNLIIRFAAAGLRSIGASAAAQEEGNHA